MELEKRTVPQLRALARRLGLKIPHRGTRKADLLKAIREEKESPREVSKFGNLSNADLFGTCIANGIRIPQGSTREEMIEALEKHQESPEEEPEGKLEPEKVEIDSSSPWSKFTLKALQAIAKAHNVEFPSRAPKRELIEILTKANTAIPWEGPEWECPTPASLIRAGLLLQVAPKSIWRAVQSRWPDYRGANGFGSIGVYRRQMIKKELLGKLAPWGPTKAGRKMLAGLREEIGKDSK